MSITVQNSYTIHIICIEDSLTIQTKYRQLIICMEDCSNNTEKPIKCTKYGPRWIYACCKTFKSDACQLSSRYCILERSQEHHIYKILCTQSICVWHERSRTHREGIEKGVYGTIRQRLGHHVDDVPVVMETSWRQEIRREVNIGAAKCYIKDATSSSRRILSHSQGQPIIVIGHLITHRASQS